MVTSILVPLDGSVLAEMILPHAATLARTTGRELILLHVTLPEAAALPLAGAVPPPSLSAEAGCRERITAGDYLAAVAAGLAPEKVAVQTAVVAGDPATEIVAYAQRHPAVQQIAMATHGQSGLRRWVFGSVAAKVLHTAPVPLLLVRPSLGAPGLQVPPARPYRTILVPLDGSLMAERALPEAQRLASATGATLILLAVVPHPEDEGLLTWADDPAFQAAIRQTETARLTRYLDQALGQFRGSAVAVRSHLAYGHPAEVILMVGEQVEADLTVLATHGRGGLQPFWLGSVALKVAEGAYRPLLLVRTGEPSDPLPA